MEDAEPSGADASTANQHCVQATPDGVMRMCGGLPSASHLDRQASLLLTDKDRIKALDAMIVAIGIVAVLITNVAYVGYLTTPGGPDPYWLDCDYQAFVAYIYLNGFAMVFSTAAIAVVTFGPFLLMAQNRASWRKQVVNVGLIHLLLSLLTLLAAFACAGFVVALADPPDINCANLKCGEGGIKCTMNTSFSLEMINGFTMDPQVAALNADALFGPQRKAQHSYGNVFCCNFNALNDGSLLNGGSDHPTCFSLFTSDSVSAATYKYGYTTWCSEAAGVYPCDLSIKLRTAAGLARACLGISLNVSDMDSDNYFISNHNRPYCLDQPQLAEHVNQDQGAIKLLPDDIIPQSSSPGDNGTFNRTHMDDPVVRQYLQSLWGDPPLRAFISNSNLSKLCSSGDLCPPLWDAQWKWQNYPSLRYQCSGGRNPTWCDYGDNDAPLKEPLAVDLEGEYLTRKSLSKYPDVILGPPPTTSQVKIGVIVMLVVAVVANACSFVLLAGLRNLAIGIRKAGQAVCDSVVAALPR